MEGKVKAQILVGLDNLHLCLSPELVVGVDVTFNHCHNHQISNVDMGAIQDTKDMVVQQVDIMPGAQQDINMLVVQQDIIMPEVQQDIIMLVVRLDIIMEEVPQQEEEDLQLTH